MNADESCPGLRIDRRFVTIATREVGNLRTALVVVRNRTSPTACDVLARDWLGHEEHDRFTRLKVQHAKADFVAGRISAKTAIAMLAGDRMMDPPGIEIQRGVWHQPCIRGTAAGLGVTLAHSGGIGIALAFDDRLRCGIDLEMRSRDAADAVATQVSEAETSWARADSTENNPRWMMLWTAREALGKCFGSGLLFNERLPATIGWEEHEDGWRAGLEDNDLLRVRSLVCRDCVCSIVLPTEVADQSVIRDTMMWMARTLSG